MWLHPYTNKKHPFIYKSIKKKKCENLRERISEWKVRNRKEDTFFLIHWGGKGWWHGIEAFWMKVENKVLTFMYIFINLIHRHSWGHFRVCIHSKIDNTELTMVENWWGRLEIPKIKKESSFSSTIRVW